jgi:DNA-binding transcriptional LysR family regulator
VVRDSGSKRDRRAVTVEVEQRWTVSNIDTSIEAVCQGHGFVWYPGPHIREAITAGPGVKRLVELVRVTVAEEC